MRNVPRETLFGVWGAGIGVCDVSRLKIMENFDSLFKAIM